MDNAVRFKLVSEAEVKVQLEKSRGPQGPAGPQGEQGMRGEQGLRGEPGTGLVIRAMYETLEALVDAHPIGETGDVYAVGTEESNRIYIWDEEAKEWTDIGRLQGPAGIAGPKGEKGDPGPEGPTSYDAGLLGGKPPEHYLQPENLLINSDFEVEGTGSYLAARWEKTGNLVFTKTGSVKKIASTSGYNYTAQRLWSDGRDRGKTYTAVVTLADGSKVVGSGTSPAEDVTSQTVIVYIIFGKGALALIKDPSGVVLFRLDAIETGAEVEFVSVDLFEGAYTAESVPPHVPKGYASELLACDVREKGDIFGMDLLWVNARPVDPFDPQSLSFDLSKYKLVGILFRLSNYTIAQTMGFCRVGSSSRAILPDLDAVNKQYVRQADTTNNSITFGAGKILDASNTENNRYMVPVAIYGMKGVGA